MEFPEVKRSSEEVRWECRKTVARKLQSLEPRQTVQSGVFNGGDDVSRDVQVLQLSQPSKRLPGKNSRHILWQVTFRQGMSMFLLLIDTHYFSEMAKINPAEVIEVMCNKLVDIHFSAGWLICPKTWVGLTLIWVFHRLAQLHSHFCQIPISPGRIGQTVEHPKSKPSQPRS